MAALHFSRVEPVHLAHGGAWTRLAALDSLRWPFLDVPVIQGQRWRWGRRWAPVGLIAVVRIPVTGGLSPGVLWIPGRPRMASGCSWALLCNYREAQRSGDSAAMFGIRLEVQRDRVEWALVRG